MVEVRQVQYGRFLGVFRPFTDVESRVVWFAAQEMDDNRRSEQQTQRDQAKEEARIQREEMRKEVLGGK